MAKQLNTRIQHKIDTEANWNAIKETFVPLSGELIIYTYADRAPQIKFGDGTKTLGQLEFIKGGLDEETINQLIETAVADQIGSPDNDTGIYANVYTKKEVDETKAPMYRYSTQDITDEILADLEPGSLYLVYEA